MCVQIPGLGKASIKALAAVNITTTFQLFGQFLLFKDKGARLYHMYLDIYNVIHYLYIYFLYTIVIIDVGSIEHIDRFYYWLQSVIPVNTGHRSAITEAIAEKMNLLFLGIYTRANYTDIEA